MFASLEKFLLTTVTSVLKGRHGGKKSKFGRPEKNHCYKSVSPFHQDTWNLVTTVTFIGVTLKGKGKKLDLSSMLGSKEKGYFSVTDQFSFKHWFCYALTSVVKCFTSRPQAVMSSPQHSVLSPKLLKRVFKFLPFSSFPSTVPLSRQKKIGDSVTILQLDLLCWRLNIYPASGMASCLKAVYSFLFAISAVVISALRSTCL